MKFVPVIVSSSGETVTRANFSTIGRAMAYGDASMRLGDGARQDVFYDFRVGTWRGKANSIKSCAQSANTKP